MINVGDALEFWSGGLFKVSWSALTPNTNTSRWESVSCDER